MNKTRMRWEARQETGILEIYLYDYIAEDGYDWWTDEPVESETSANHVKRLLSEAPDTMPVNLYINSYGGSVKEGLAIYNLIKRHSGLKTAYVDGFACSIASVIPMACNKIVMGSNTLMMIHRASMGVYGNPIELRKAADDLEVIDSASNQSYLDHAGEKLDPGLLEEMLDAEKWLTAKECLELGLCDEITGQAEQKTPPSMEQRIRQCFAPKVPEQFAEEKTMAERLMKAFCPKKKEKE